MMRILDSGRLTILCVAFVVIGALIGAFKGERGIPVGPPLSLVASVESKGRRIHSDLYRISVSNNTYVICAETPEMGERMCSEGKIDFHKHRVDLSEQGFERFSGGIPVSKGTSCARWRFHVVFASDTAVVIYSPLVGMFALKKVI
jgi:hypothetical protein